MGKLFGKKKRGVEVQARVETKSFFDCIAPTTIKFYANYFLVGDTYRCVWVIREYPPSTEEQAILAHLADHSGVTLRIYNRLVEAYEQRQIANNATRKNRLKLGDTDINESVQAEQNLLDVQQLLVTLSREKQPLIHCAVFLELKAKSMSALESLQSDISMELTRSKITADRLTLRQKEGFLSAMPFGFNCFGSQFERVLPASAVGNMFPFNFSGKTDPKGFYIGRDKYGTNILVDLDRRGDDKTNSNVLILGNSGQGKSYLMKLLLTNLRESGKRVLVMDAEGEYGELAVHNGGCCLDFLDGQYMINILEPKVWASEPVEDPDAPEAFRRSGRISQHIAFLKDWFRSYKDFTDAEVDTIEIMLSQLYKNFGLTEKIDFTELHPEDYPILSDLYELCIQEYHCYDPKRKPLYTEETLRNICLGLNSVCVGSESRFFNGHTNIQDNMFLVFGVKGVMDLNKKLRCAIEFNMIDAELSSEVGAAQALYIMALYDYSSQPGFVSRLVSCFGAEQTDDQLVANVNAAFGTDIVVQDFTNVMRNVRSRRIDTTKYVDCGTKNNLDLVQWAISAYQSRWGYVMGTFGQVLTVDLLEAKLQQLPDAIGPYEDYILTNYLGVRTADCIGLIKGYSWHDPESGNINYGSNGMPDVSADQIYAQAAEKGSMATMPEIPGILVHAPGHIGIYIGNGYAIEAMGTRYGVVKTAVASRNWTGWCKNPYINYIEETEEDT